MRLARANVVVLVAIAACALSRPGRAQAVASPSDTVSGRVVNEYGVAVPHAAVVATMIPNRISATDSTDEKGMFRIVFARGTGEYLLYVAMPGYRVVRQRVTIGSGASQVATIRLAPMQAQNLSAFRVTAKRPRLSAESGGARSLATDEVSAGEGVSGAVPPDQSQSVEAQVLTLPGVLGIPGGGLALNGLAGLQQTTLNGLTFLGGDLPREFGARIRLATTSWDPSVGGFASGRVNIEVGSGYRGPGYSAEGKVALSAAPLQGLSPASRALGRAYTNVRMSGGVAGSLRPSLRVNAAMQVSDRWSEVRTLASADATILRGGPLLSDSIPAILSALRARGVPLEGTAPGWQRMRTGTLVGWIGYDPSTRTTAARTTLGLTAIIAARLGEAPGRGFLSTTGVGSSNRAISTQALGSLAHWFSDGLVTELTVAAGQLRSQASPYVTAPALRVDVLSSLPDGTTGIAPIASGGAAEGAMSNARQFVETASTTTAYMGRRHRLRAYANLRWEGSRATAGTSFGSYAYTSLDALRVNTPSRFTRTLDALRTGAGVWNATFGIGDVWTVTSAVQVETALRVEGAQFAGRPPLDSVARRLLDASRASVPHQLTLVPRVGFVWAYGGRPQVGALTSALGRFSLPPRGLLSGGFGLFRQSFMLGWQERVAARSTRGGSPRVLTCVGDAVPPPVWSEVVSEPTDRCVGTAGDGSSDSAGETQAFASNFRSPSTWRANLRWASAAGLLRFSVDANVGWTAHQLSVVDRNFSDVAVFHLGDERARPVFVPVSDIDASSGIVTPVAARALPREGRVRELRSDLQSFSQNVLFSVMPVLPGSRVVFNAAYLLSQVRADSRGFDGTTSASPLVVERGRGAMDVRHQIVLQGGYDFGSSWWLTAFLRVNSGVPFTPVVDQDINGDGLRNDRAFVFDPRMTSDPAVSGGMRALLSRTSRGATRCLRDAFGRVAQPNACDGPWSTALHLVLGTHNIRAVDDRPMSMQFTFWNVLGAVDDALHGATRLRGWGPALAPDPTLLYVRGFDPVARRFRYLVNPSFGSVSPASHGARSPYGVSLEFRTDLGTPAERQAVARQLDRGSRLTEAARRAAADTLAQLYAESVPDPYAAVLAAADSILLSTEQIARLRSSATDYAPRAHAVWTALGEWMVSLPPSYDARLVVRRVDAVTATAWRLIKAERPRILAVLTPLQESMLPAPLVVILKSPKPIPVRYAVY
ncbi:MAG: carboxypeptidase regulatory-like domain-containing protein [Gemmatimonadaceae bacterium]|nr:carboxypeptidase regulatory-like domain-containing protein [Gemmatimonadaceae bacterium]